MTARIERKHISMDTDPIEMAPQDIESPVDPAPTPEQETDITVSETGTTSNGDGSNGIGSLAGNIILPATILVLVIGAIAALIVRRYYKRKKANN